MSDKPKLSLFQIISRIFLGLSSFICLLMSIFYLLTAFKSDEPRYAPMIIFLVLALLFVPVYARLFGSMGKSLGEGVNKAAPFIRGGLFILRLFACFILTMFFVTEFDRIKSEIFSTFHFSASSAEMSQLVNFIQNDQREELLGAIYEIQSHQKEIDFPLLIARNFETALDQAENDPTSSPDIYGSYALEQRLSLNVFSTVDSVFGNLKDYESTKMARYLAPQKMLNLLLDYGKYYLRYDKIPEANIYFQAAGFMDPDNPDMILTIGDIYKEMNFLKETAQCYEQYSSLMKNDGKEEEIPKRVIKFLEDEMYGERLQKNLFECWLQDQTVDPYFTQAYYEMYHIDYMYIGDRLYGPYWASPVQVLFGPQYSYTEQDSLNCGLAGCVAKLLGREPEKMNIRAIKELCGMEFYSERDLPFTHINPAIIDWARKNLIPNSSVMLFDKPCRTIYSTLFRNAFRHKARAYTFLQTYYDGSEIATDYEYRMYDDGFYAPDYLYDQFGGHAENAATEDYDPWSLTMDAGFWVRRFIDGTASECWRLLSAIMNQYDQVWFNRVWEGWGMPEEYYPEDESGEYDGI